MDKNIDWGKVMKNSTKAILAKRLLLHDISAQDYIEWAVDMLVKGDDSPSLRILAGLDRHNRFLEVESYFLRSIKELNIEEMEGTTAIRSYANEVFQQIINEQFSSSQLVVKTLSQIYWNIYQLYVSYDHANNYDLLCEVDVLLKDFNIWRELDNTIEALIVGDFPHDYPSATLENFDTIVQQETEKFTAKMASYNS
jgi:hypothetical protein